MDAASGGWLQAQAPESDRLARLLRDQGAAVDTGPGGVLAVRGASAAAVGELAARHQITLHELVARQASLEEAFMDLTHDAVDYRPHLPTRERRPGHDYHGYARPYRLSVCPPR